MFLLPQISVSSSHSVVFAHRTDLGHPPCQAQVLLWEWPIRDLQIGTKFQHCTLHQVNSLATQLRRLNSLCHRSSDCNSTFKPGDLPCFSTPKKTVMKNITVIILWDVSLSHRAQRQALGGFNQPPALTLRGGVGGQRRGCGEWRGQRGTCVPQFGETGQPISHRTCLHAAIETAEGEIPQAPVVSPM